MTKDFASPQLAFSGAGVSRGTFSYLFSAVLKEHYSEARNSG